MSLAVAYSRAQSGINGLEVVVEVHLANGLPALSIVGLPELAVRESKDRVRGALLNSLFEFPARRITINLAPADLPKEGGRFDLAIAMGILGASGQIPLEELSRYEFLGELALSGALRPISGVLPAALAARSAGRALILPEECAAEAALVEGLTILPARHLLDISQHLVQGSGLTPYQSAPESAGSKSTPDLAEVKGQPHAKRALEIAAAGGHSLLMIGPPGSGKSMLASRLPGILPPMNEQEALETAAIASISNQELNIGQWKRRPFRTPHHSASAAALVGGGSNPKPGEISLAHNGVMFLDELPEFDRRVLEVLREPMENAEVTISRAVHQSVFPARFQLITAMNPCPCGHLGDSHGKSCHCTGDQVKRYRGKISGPLLDRIDMHIEVPRQSLELITGRQAAREESSEEVRERVERARRRQMERSGCTNSALEGQSLESCCRVDDKGQQLLHRAMDQLGLSARAYHRILRLARTIADLKQREEIDTQHLSEAISYRRLDRKE
ncbi:MAG: YifB family Mg chelatase-like AAA ATPase [Candidatus Sedimenticola sp. 4PFRAG1]